MKSGICKPHWLLLRVCTLCRRNTNHPGLQLSRETKENWRCLNLLKPNHWDTLLISGFPINSTVNLGAVQCVKALRLFWMEKTKQTKENHATSWLWQSFLLFGRRLLDSCMHHSTAWAASDLTLYQWNQVASAFKVKAIEEGLCMLSIKPRSCFPQELLFSPQQ